MNFWRQLSTYNSYAELAARPRTVFVQDSRGFSLLRNISLTRGLGCRDEVPLDASLDGNGSLLTAGEPVVISVSERLCFLHNLELPRAAIRKISGILEIELARIAPFSPGTIVSGWRVRDIACETNLLPIEHIVILNSVVEPVLQAVRTAGASPICILVHGEHGEVRPVALPVDGKDFRRSDYQRWWIILAALWCAFLLMSAAFALVLPWQQSTIVANIESQSRLLDVEVAAANLRQEEIRRAHLQLSALRTRKLQTVSRLEIVEELSELIPDQAYLNEMTVDGTSVAISGEALSPQDLVPVLESSKLFRNAKLTSPIIRLPGEPRSRFSLAFDLESSYTQ